MAAYLKTDMPFYGIQTKGRVPIMRMVKRKYAPADLGEYIDAVSALWSLPHREEKYLAIEYARAFPNFIISESLPLYQRMVTEGAWWDLVDGLASWVVGRALLNERDTVEPIVRSWILDDDLWLRRTSIICQLNHKADTDTVFLDDACTANLADPDFFIRKAIGWALRQYARTDEEWVRTYVAAHSDDLPPLSRREAMKHLE